VTKAYQDINRDTEAANRGVKPAILTDVYGSNPPAAAEFGKGVSDQAGAQQAQDARRTATPGDYDHRR
jgi:hypothetical protein